MIDRDGSHPCGAMAPLALLRGTILTCPSACVPSGTLVVAVRACVPERARQGAAGARPLSPSRRPSHLSCMSHRFSIRWRCRGAIAEGRESSLVKDGERRGQVAPVRLCIALAVACLREGRGFISFVC